jgi:hypothetical protein
VQLDATPSGLVAGNAYGWTVRQLSRSPYFRYGAWLDPQPNAVELAVRDIQGRKVRSLVSGPLVSAGPARGR